MTVIEKLNLSLHVLHNQRDPQMEHVIERSLRAHGHEIQGQLHQHPGAPVWEKGSLGRTFVPVKTVLNAVQENEEVICSVMITVNEATSLVGISQL